MRILVEANGHQYSNSYEGEVLCFGQTVENFNSMPMQVPCMTLDTGKEIRVIPLKEQFTSIMVTKLD